MRNTTLNRRLQSSASTRSNIPNRGDAVHIILLLMFFLFVDTAVCFSAPPIYVSIVLHIEQYPDYVHNPALFLNKRSEILYLAHMLHDNGIKLDFQSDWNFLEAVALYDSGDGTYGLNIVKYMHDSLGFEIDPHAHQTTHNYADVAHCIEDLGVVPTNVAGGFVVSPPETSEFEEFFAPIESDSFPGYFWQAEIVWGGSNYDHIGDSLLWASGVWRPVSSENFFVHSDTAPVINVGNYRPEWCGLYDLLEKGDMGLLDTTKMFTVAIFIPQDRLTHEQTDALEDTIRELAELVATGRIIFATIQEIVDIWRTEYDSVPNIYKFIEVGITDDYSSGQPSEILMRAFPNPFNSSVAITVSGGRSLASQTLTNIKVYDIRGNVVYAPSSVPSSSGHLLPEGEGQILPSPTGRGTEGEGIKSTFIWRPDKSIASGLYLIRATTQDGQTITKRIVYLK